MNLSPALARFIAFLVGAAVFIGIMAFVGIAFVGPVTDWLGNQAPKWPAEAKIAFIVAVICIPLFLSRLLHRRDQRREATDRPTR